MNNEILKIIFLTYLTNYNIRDIYDGLQYTRTSNFIEDFLRAKKEKNQEVPESFVKEVKKTYLERYEEMIYAGINFITINNEMYPSDLKMVPHAPPMLYVKGNFRPTSNIAIVGTRDASLMAEQTVEKIISGLSKKENGVVSGLALGIDTIAHQKALKNGIYTIAVMPNSLERVYPKENYKLANDILLNGGALISELATGINRGKKSFVERNRIQVGISEFVIPIEMSIESGTMHTVDYCIKQNKYILNFEPTDEQKSLPQYEGILHLKNKRNIKRVVLKNDFNLADIKKQINHTLFEI